MTDIMSFAWSFLIWPLSLGILLGAGFLQLRLLSRKSPWPGLVPLAVLCVVCLSATAWMFYTEAQYDSETLTCSLKDGMTAEAVVYLDGKGEVLRVTDIFIKDEAGEKLDDIGWGEFRFRDIQEKVRGTYDLDEDTSPDFGDEEGFVRINGTGYYKTCFVYVMLYLGVPLLGIYLFKRLQLRRKRRERETERVNLQAL